jgi:formylmethanofuran dehydrogenase subunit B
MPLFGGLGTDVAGMREVLALAERTGGIVDHAGAPGLLANIRAMQDGGTVTTTLAEVRNRADLALVIATDVAALSPRFFERCLAPATGLFGPLRRELVHLGPGTPLPGAEVIACEADRVGEAVAALRALAAGHRLAAATAGGVPVASLAALAERLKQASYPVIVWAARDLPGRHPDLAVSCIAGLLRELNAKGRCCGVTLTGPDDIVGANQVCTWQSGVPLRTSFASGAPDHDPERWSIEAALAAADCLVWLSAIGTQPLPAKVKVPVIALVRPGHPLPEGVAVTLPVGTPGVDHAGRVNRTDGVVALPVRRLRDLGLPSAAAMLAAIRDRLAERRAA